MCVRLVHVCRERASVRACMRACVLACVRAETIHILISVESHQSSKTSVCRSLALAKPIDLGAVCKSRRASFHPYRISTVRRQSPGPCAVRLAESNFPLQSDGLTVYKIEATLLGDHFLPNRKIILMAAVEFVDSGVRRVEAGSALPLLRDTSLTASWAQSWLETAEAAACAGLSEEQCVPSIQKMVIPHEGAPVQKGIPNVKRPCVLIRASRDSILQEDGAAVLEVQLSTFTESAGTCAIYANDVHLQGITVRGGWDERNVSVDCRLFLPGMVHFQAICRDNAGGAAAMFVSEVVPVGVLRGKTWPTVSVELLSRMHASDNFSHIQTAADGTVTISVSVEIRFDYAMQFDADEGV